MSAWTSTGMVMDDRDTERTPARRTRADALRNREQILRATIDLVAGQGPGVAMDVIARRAGVGVATLYRHFADRSSLYAQVQYEVLRRCADEAEAALREENDAFAALARYMHKAIDLRASAVMPLLNDRVSPGEELVAARKRGRDAIESLVARAHRERALRPDVSTADIAMLIIRVSRPVPGISMAQNLELSHRHLELLLDGVLRFLADEPLPGPVVSVEELAAAPRRPAG
jgi:AcrR family transcriptional regulator